MCDSFDSEKLFSLIPRLLESETFCRALEANLEDDSTGLLERFRRGEALSTDDSEVLFDAAFEAFRENLTAVLSLAWDGGFPGMSGAIWVSELAGVFAVTSTDYSPMGPFESLDEALACECLNIVTPDPELDSAVLPMERLLNVARGVVDWENAGEIWINSERYTVQGNELVADATD